MFSQLLTQSTVGEQIVTLCVIGILLSGSPYIAFAKSIVIASVGSRQGVGHNCSGKGSWTDTLWQIYCITVQDRFAQEVVGTHSTLWRRFGGLGGKHLNLLPGHRRDGGLFNRDKEIECHQQHKG